MKLTALLIPADRDKPVRVLELVDPDFRTYQRLVGGRMFDALDIPHGGTLFLDDEGKLTGAPPNIRATSLLYLLRPEYIGRDFLAGDIILMGQPDDQGDTTSAPTMLVQLLDPAAR